METNSFFHGNLDGEIDRKPPTLLTSKLIMCLACATIAGQTHNLPPFQTMGDHPIGIAEVTVSLFAAKVS